MHDQINHVIYNTKRQCNSISPSYSRLTKATSLMSWNSPTFSKVLHFKEDNRHWNNLMDLVPANRLQTHIESPYYTTSSRFVNFNVPTHSLRPRPQLCEQ